MLISVAISASRLGLLDYRPLEPLDKNAYMLGKRVLVPLGTRVMVGVIVKHVLLSETDCPIEKLRPIVAVLDLAQPTVSQALLHQLIWASQYYHAGLGAVCHAAIPKQLMRADPENILTASELLNESVFQDPKISQMADPVELTTEQHVAVQALCQKIDIFQVWVLDGVTGSGKTEVYCRLMQKILGSRRQVLYLVPEIGLTSQTITRIQSRFPNAKLVVYHSQLTEKQKYLAWRAAKTGEAHIILGTRSASLLDFKQLGGCILDEEHDSSYQQQAQFRYCAKNFLIKRAFDLKIPIVLGSATPSLETIYNVNTQKFKPIKLTQRVYQSVLSKIHCVNLKKTPVQEGLARPVLQLIRQKLDQQEQVLIFLNRRGYAPVLLCDDCQWQAECRDCDARLTIHQKKNKLICHHCLKQADLPTLCPKCQSPALIRMGLGTERLEKFLEKTFESARIIRLDQDTMTPKKLRTGLDQIHNQEIDLILGTQMIAKGHDFQHVTLVVIVDLDSALFASDFRATERMGQLLVQVSGRTGRAQEPGQIVLQTRYPDHPVLKNLLNQNYTDLTDYLLTERQASGLPPWSHQAIVQVRSRTERLNIQVLNRLKETIPDRFKKIACFGPQPCLRGKQGGYYQTQLLFQSTDRSVLQDLLKYLSQTSQSRAVTWMVHVDPKA